MSFLFGEKCRNTELLLGTRALCLQGISLWKCPRMGEGACSGSEARGLAVVGCEDKGLQGLRDMGMKE